MNTQIEKSVCMRMVLVEKFNGFSIMNESFKKDFFIAIVESQNRNELTKGAGKMIAEISMKIILDFQKLKYVTMNQNDFSDCYHTAVMCCVDGLKHFSMYKIQNNYNKCYSYFQTIIIRSLTQNYRKNYGL